MFVSLFPNWLGQTQPRVLKMRQTSPEHRNTDQIRRKGNQLLPDLEAERSLTPDKRLKGTIRRQQGDAKKR
jgi:hypothetical protein